MKLLSFENKDNYVFDVTFINHEHYNVDLHTLIASKVTIEELETAHIDDDWGCLEFKGALVDIEPKTLYSFCCAHGMKLDQSA